MNIWIFTGRVGRDAELRSTQGGEKVLGFTVANDVGFGDRKTTQWVDCSLWGKRAEALANYVKKGDKITVSGELKLEDFQRRDGSQGSKLSVRVAEIELGGNKQNGDNDTQQAGSRGGGYGNGKSNGDWQAPLSGGGGRSGGGKPALDPIDDEITFAYLEGIDNQGCACGTNPRAKSMKFEA